MGKFEKKLKFILSETEKMLSEVIKNNIGDTPAKFYYLRGDCYKGLERYIEALQDKQRAVDIRPYAEANISNETFYERITIYMRKCGIDF